MSGKLIAVIGDGTYGLYDDGPIRYVDHGPLPEGIEIEPPGAAVDRHLAAHPEDRALFEGMVQESWSVEIVDPNAVAVIRLRPSFSLRQSRLKWWLMYWFRRKRFEAVFKDEVERMQMAMLDNIRRRFTCGDGYTTAQAGITEGGGE